jgi:hypothetical protein
MRKYTEFSKDDINGMNLDLKVGILGTVNPEGLPHLTLISTLQAGSTEQVIWGQFTEGLSKKYVYENPRTGFLVMTLDKELWRGKATFTYTAKGGKEYEMYNNVPMFRYNAYFGVHTVYYMDLVEQYGRESLPMGKVVVAAIQSMMVKIISNRNNDKKALNLWTQNLLNKLDNLKFISYIGNDGYPVVFPVIQAQALDSHRIVFATSAYKSELGKIPEGGAIAILGMSFDMEDVVMRGIYCGLSRKLGVSYGMVEVDWVYNSMPPKPQQIYPPVSLEAVKDF